MITSLGLDLNELDQLAQLPTALAMAEAGPFLEYLVNEPAFLTTHLRPLLNRVAPSQDPYIAHTYISPEGGCSLQVFVWASGARTAIHDHTSWGAYCCAIGSLVEERYERLDDEAEPNHAHLRAVWRRISHGGDGVSTVAPYAGGIHRVGNPNGRLAISVHLYGPRMGTLDGRDYNPARDYVCNRFE